jgi:Putative DNA-binding domain
MQQAEFTRFAQALCDRSGTLPGGLVSRAGTALDDRFAVYRNNVHVSLVDALRDRFPIVLQMVGDEFFAAMARDHVVAHKPASPQLQEYGADFPQHVARFVPAQNLPFLPDMARLEYAWSESWAAAEAPAVSLDAIATMTTEALLQACVKRHPAARLLRSGYPVGTLWQLHQSPDPDLANVEWRPQDVLITRPQAEVKVSLLVPGVAAMASALMNGATVEVAAITAAAESPALDFGQALGGLINGGFITRITTP